MLLYPDVQFAGHAGVKGLGTIGHDVNVIMMFFLGVHRSFGRDPSASPQDFSSGLRRPLAPQPQDDSIIVVTLSKEK